MNFPQELLNEFDEVLNEMDIIRTKGLQDA
jgi:metal-responsive CopG/Arc/MetJ family transcriptional regulator